MPERKGEVLSDGRASHAEKRMRKMQGQKTKEEKNLFQQGVTSPLVQLYFNTDIFFLFQPPRNERTELKIRTGGNNFIPVCPAGVKKKKKKSQSTRVESLDLLSAT